MIKSCLITILVPIYNCESYLDKCITSILNQDHRNLQIVLANDGSMDNSLDICKKYAAKDPRITVLNGPNKGVATTRNILLDHIKGNYFLFVDADDWIEPDMVSYLLGLIKRYNADIAICSKYLGSSDHNVIPKIKYWDQKQAIEKFLRHQEISGALWNKLIKSSLIGNVQFNPSIYYGEDALFCWCIFQKIHNIVISNKPLYHQTANPNSLSRSAWTPDKKGSSHRVWETIVTETNQNWTEFSDIAKARYGLEEMWSLYFASCANYKYDNQIKLRQSTLKFLLPFIKKHKLEGKEKYIIAIMLSRYYSLGKIIQFISKKLLKRGI